MMRNDTSSIYQSGHSIYSPFKSKSGYNIRGYKGRFKGSTGGIYGYS